MKFKILKPCKSNQCKCESGAWFESPLCEQDEKHNRKIGRLQ